MSDNIKTIFSDGNDSEAISLAASILKRGGLVAFPTETVYGLGADALNAEAAAKIYAAKGRPSDNPLIVHIADTSAVYELASEVPQTAIMLMEAFWPGPLTIILPKKKIVPDGTTGGLNTVAIRMPSHPAALNMIRESGVYVAAPSANTSGRPSPTTARHVADDMTGRIDMILDGGAVGIGIESTIVDLTGEVPTILRPGFITKSMLEAIVGEVLIDKALISFDENIRPKAPGMKYTHYAPKGELSIVELETDDAGSSGQAALEPNAGIGNAIVPGDSSDDVVRNEIITDIKAAQLVAAKINELVSEKVSQDFKVAVITTEEHKALYDCEHILTAGSSSKGETIAARLYAVLRECDALGADYIYTESFNQVELGGAIMNRLIKAAGHRIIKIRRTDI